MRGLRDIYTESEAHTLVQRRVSLCEDITFNQALLYTTVYGDGALSRVSRKVASWHGMA